MGLRVGGLATGLDTNALIDSLLTLERRPLELAQQRKVDLEREQSLFRDLNTKLLALREAAAGLDNRSSGLTGAAVSEEFLAYSASSSNETAVTATATGEASPGTIEVTVNALAQSARRITTQFTSQTDIIANEGETLTIGFGGEADIEITVGAGGASLVDLRSAINADLNNGGAVRAEVIDDGTGFRLVISGTETGASHDLSITTDIANGASPFVDAALSQAATNAQLEVFGIAVTRETNTITDLVPGVTLELNSTTTDPVEITVAVDEESINAEFENFLSVYNEVINFITDQSSVEAKSGVAGPLSGDSTLRGIQQTVQRVMISGPQFAGNSLRSLSQVGLSLDSKGVMSLDAEKLSAALAEDPNAIRELLSGDGTTDGIATALARALDPLTDSDPKAGLLASRNAGIETRMTGLDDQISRIELRLEKREELLVAQFTQLESLISQLNNQGNALSSLQF